MPDRTTGNSDARRGVEELMMVFDGETRTLQHITPAMRKIFAPSRIDDLIGCDSKGLAFTMGKRLYPNNPKAARDFYRQAEQIDKCFEEDKDLKQGVTSHAYEHDGRYYKVTMNFVRVCNSANLVILRITFREIPETEYNERLSVCRQFETSFETARRQV